jgi:hypothetical protein
MEAGLRNRYLISERTVVPVDTDDSTIFAVISHI